MGEGFIMEDTKSTNLVTGVGTINYVNVNKQSSYFGGQGSNNGQDAKFSVAFIYGKDDTETIEGLNKAINNAIEKGYNTIWKNISHGNIISPIKDGDITYPTKKEYQDSLHFTATTKFQPTVITRQKSRIDPRELYPGCKCRLSISCYPYIYEDKIGVAVNLRNILKVADGERIVNVKSAEDDFADFCDNEETW